jgi:hypothetical protein
MAWGSRTPSQISDKEGTDATLGLAKMSFLVSEMTQVSQGGEG